VPISTILVASSKGLDTMKNFVQQGDTITLTAPYARTSGQGMLVGSIFGVASTDAASGATVEAAVAGVFDLTKVSAQAWVAGNLIYWDDTAKNCTTAVSTNKLIGVAVAADANPSSTGRVRLNGAFIA
jgi:predicted RecA/RadA family phage recombinase